VLIRKAKVQEPAEKSKLYYRNEKQLTKQGFMENAKKIVQECFRAEIF